jgi:hypothetical protein
LCGFWVIVLLRHRNCERSAEGKLTPPKNNQHLPMHQQPQKRLLLQMRYEKTAVVSGTTAETLIIVAERSRRPSSFFCVTFVFVRFRAEFRYVTNVQKG